MSATTETRVTVTLRLLARYAEVVGAESLVVEVGAPATVGDVLVAARVRWPALTRLPANPLCAVNFRQVRATTPVANGDEVAILPPVAGG
jgi:molybdopterin synthase catalytic subunit